MVPDNDVDVEVLVRFTTRHRDPAMHVPATPLAVPSSTARRGLSDVVNALLNRTSVPTPFDFFIDGVRITGPLGRTISSLGISLETTVTLEYAPCIRPPSDVTPAHADTPASAACFTGTLLAPRLQGEMLVGAFDGSLRVVTVPMDLTDASGVVVSTVPDAHAAPVTDVCALRDRCVSSAKDGTVVVWGAEMPADVTGFLEGRKAPAPLCLARLEGAHTDGGVEAVALAPGGDRVATAGADGRVALWRVDDAALEKAARAAGDSKEAAAPTRKRKAAPSADTADVSTLSAAATLSGHAAAVHGLAWSDAGGGNGALFSGSWDGTVRQWDAGAGALITHAAVGYAVSTASARDACDGEVPPLLAFGGARGAWGIWDPRMAPVSLSASAPSAASRLKTTGTAHASWVRRLAFQPNSECLVASASLDGSVCIWDLRGLDVPLHTLHGIKPKSKTKNLTKDAAPPALGLAWLGSEAVAAAYANGEIYAFPVTSY